MKNTSKIVLGLALIAAGVLWILNLTGVLNFTFSTTGWWTLFIIIPCLVGLFSDTDKLGPCIGLSWGILLLLAVRGVISWNQMWQIGLAVMIIVFGIKILFFKSCCPHQGACEVKNISRDGKDVRRIETSFGKQNLSFPGQRFEGADVQTSFGGLTLDLRGAVLADESFIDLNVGFAGVSIIVPEGLAVQVSVNSGFGGVSDNRQNKVTAGTPLLIITGKVGFGGVEIKN